MTGRGTVACVAFAGLLMGPAAAWSQAFCANPMPAYSLDSGLPGDAPRHEFTFDVASGELQMAQALLIYPAQFVFNGFAADSGRSANSRIGTMFFDIGPDGTEDFSAPIRAISEHHAYVDLNDSGVRHYLEPTISHAVDADGRHQFRLINYFGGDRDPDGKTATVSLRQRLELNAGILANPMDSGTYTLSGTFISVNWVTGDAPQRGDANFLTCSFDTSFTIQDVANWPPVADAGADQTVEATSVDGAQVMLNGSGSYDPDGDTLAFRWLQNSTPIAYDELAEVLLGLGQHVIALQVSDSSGATDFDTLTIDVVDTTPPDITAPADITLDCTRPDGTKTDLGQPSVSDAATLAEAIRLENDAPELFPIGTTTITWTATDAAGNQSTTQQNVTVADNSAPVITLSVSPNILWPPNHRMADVVTTVGANDACDPSPVVELVNVTMNEGDEELTFDAVYDATVGDGHTTDDIQYNAATGQMHLRAERSGAGGGRIYTITYQATDGSGNSTTASATVTVPHAM